MKKQLFLVGVLAGVVFASCDDKSPSREVVFNDINDAISYSWNDTFERSIADFWSQQIVDKQRAVIVNDPLNSANEVLKVTLEPSDVTNGGHRSEFVVKHFDSIGYLNTYEFKFMLPESFFKEQDKNSWFIIHQWHDEPPAGYTWATKKHKTKPPIALTISYTPQEGYRLFYKDGLETGNLDEVKRFIWPEPLQPNVWYTFTNSVFWSLYATHGYSEPRLNGLVFELAKNSKTTDATQIIGRNMYNAQGNYFKFGLYQGSGEQHTRHIYLDDFYMSTKRQSYWFE